MKNKKKLKKIAKLCFRESLTNSFVDSQKVRKILKSLLSQKGSGLGTILRIYKRMLETKLAEEEVTVEASEKIANEKKFEAEILAKTGARKVIFRINPKITIGARVTHGNWIYDSTLSSKLGQIKAI